MRTSIYSHYIGVMLIVVVLVACGQATPTPTLAPGQEAIPGIQADAAIDLSGAWRAAAVTSFSPEMTTDGFDDSGWAEVQAPGSWQAQGFGELTGSGGIVVYRKTVPVPKEWKGQQVGISAWLNPLSSQVYINGEKIEPQRMPFAPYAPVTVTPGGEATITVVTKYDGSADMAESGPPRLGPLGELIVTRLARQPLKITLPGKPETEGYFIYPENGEKLPGLLLVSTGTHGEGEVQGWENLAADLARLGYLIAAPVIPDQTPEAVLAGLQALRANPAVDPNKIAIIAADQAAGPAVQAAVQDGNIQGMALLSSGKVGELEQLGKPVLAMATTNDQRGRVLKAVQELAQSAPGQIEVVELPGDAHGTYVLATAWNAFREPFLEWLQKIGMTTP